MQDKALAAKKERKKVETRFCILFLIDQSRECLIFSHFQIAFLSNHKRELSERVHWLFFIRFFFFHFESCDRLVLFSRTTLVFSKTVKRKKKRKQNNLKIVQLTHFKRIPCKRKFCSKFYNILYFASKLIRIIEYIQKRNGINKKRRPRSSRQLCWC